MLVTIPNFPNYAITKDGRVWSKRFHRWLKSCKNTHGYIVIALCRNKKHFTERIHRLILETFVGVCPNGKQCRHLNGIKTDNRLENLCWGTPRENGQDTKKHGNHIGINEGIENGQSKLIEQDIRIIIYMHRTGEFTQREIANIYNVTDATVSKIINKKLWKHIWRV